MLTKLHVLLFAAIALCLGSTYLLRRDYAEPNDELMTERQMARSPAFGSYDPNPNFADEITFRQPVPGTIARGAQAFAYAATPVEAARAGKELSTPLDPGSAATRAQGGALYATYCQ